VIVGCAQRAVQIHQALLRAGFWVSAIRPPTVPADTSRLRVTFSVSHAESDVDALAAAVGEAIRETAAMT
jgi:8-amino-7-oxononanoate synthase